MREVAFLGKSCGRRIAALGALLVACGSCGGDEQLAAPSEPFDEAVFVPAIPASVPDAALQQIARAIALPEPRLLEAVRAAAGLEAARWAQLLAGVEVDREHPYTHKPDRDDLGRHRLAWRVRAAAASSAELAALDDLRAIVELEVWAAALSHIAPTHELRASALGGTALPPNPKRVGERAELALARLAARGISCDRWEPVRRWCR
ncbi:MAG: hypothetical protein IPN34_26685 [Planctomycetes bacterium]|nr:hypothetical protein [Planctomycetota bacterium]